MNRRTTPSPRPVTGRRRPLGRWLARTHGAALIATGAWPLVHLRSFELVTGPKHEDWLVRMVGGLAVAFGAGMLWRADDPRAVRPFGLAAATTFAAADVIGVTSGRLRRVYLLNAIVEGAFIVGWLVLAGREGRSSTPRRVGVPVLPDRPRSAPAPDLGRIRRDVEDRHRDAVRAASRAWPTGGAPDVVTEALHRLDEAREQLTFATEGDDPDRLRELAAVVAEDAASVHEAADLVSS